MRELLKTVAALRSESSLAPCRGLTVDLYQGCSHGCVYCWINHMLEAPRESLPLTKEAEVKHFLQVLHNDPRSSFLVKNRVPLSCGHSTDNLQPCEKNHRLLFVLLRTLLEASYPVKILTKSKMICEEPYSSVIHHMSQQDLILIGMTLCTMKPDLASGIEPNAPSPADRMSTIRRLKRLRVPVFLNVRPIIPGINDCEIEDILKFGEEADVAGYKIDFLGWPLKCPQNYDVYKHLADAVGTSKDHVEKTLENHLSDESGYSLSYKHSIITNCRKMIRDPDNRIVYPNCGHQPRLRNCAQCPSGRFTMQWMRN